MAANGRGRVGGSKSTGDPGEEEVVAGRRAATAQWDVTAVSDQHGDRGTGTNMGETIAARGRQLVWPRLQCL